MRQAKYPNLLLIRGHLVINYLRILSRGALRNIIQLDRGLYKHLSHDNIYKPINIGKGTNRP